MRALEYVQNQANVRIDTGIQALSIGKITIKVSPQSGYTDYGAFYANRGNTSNGTRYLALFTRSNGFQCRTGNDQGTPFPFTVGNEYVCECDMVNTRFTVNGELGSTSGLGTIDNSNVFLFWDPAWNSDSRHVYFKFYYCKIYDYNNVLLRDFVPKEDDNGIVCLYDNVTSVYYYTPYSSFIKGPYLIPSYTIEYNSNGGTGTMPSQTAELDTYVTLDTCTFTRDGYTFIGWSTTSSGSVQYSDGDTVYNLAPQDTSITLYAVWRKNPPYLIIQTNNSEKISLTKELTDILQTPFTLKDETSIIDPVFVINASLDMLLGANYVTAPSLGRKFFINDITSVTNDLVELSCHVDVLSSFADEIKANKGIVHRQENNWNLYLNDGVLQTYQNPIVTTVEFPNGFTEHNFVAVLAGSRGGGVQIGEGGVAQVTPSVTYNDGGGSGGNENATTAGLVQYAYAQVGEPYWWGTFGNMADANLLDYKRKTQGDYYPNPGDPPFEDQFGHRVHDCVGLIKGYRWRGPFSTADPHYEASQDVDVKGLWNQCIKYRGRLDDASNKPFIGAVVFYDDFTHCGVLVERNVVVEAKGHLFGVVQSQLASRPKFTYWGVPDWMRINTARFSD